MPHRVAIVGLGAVGQRFLALMSAHPRFQVTGAWDRDPAVRAATGEKYPDLAMGPDGAAIAAAADTDLVYVAVPPLAHKDYVLAALAAGKAIFCEKPLGIDVADSRDLVARVEASGLPNAVNFVYASAPAGREIQARLAAGSLGALAGVDIRLHFAAWPRGWQEHATWLAGRAQGGFLREVLSHFVYLTERLFGPAALRHGAVRYPAAADAAETHAFAELDCAGLPVTVAGSVGGVGPDLVEYTVWGAARSCRLRDWYRLYESDGGDWLDVPLGGDAPGPTAYKAQLDNLADLLDGKPHSMPDFRAALSVQELIEALLTTSA